MLDIKVLHADHSVMKEIWFESDKVAYAKSHINQYEHIANVSQTSSGTLTSILDQVYRDTNSIETSWFENDNVRLMQEGSRYRSTSVGDIFIINDDKYMVDSVGFTYFE